MLNILPPEGHEYKPYPLDTEFEHQMDVNSFLLKTVTHALHISAGFNVKLVRFAHKNKYYYNMSTIEMFFSTFTLFL